MLTAKAPTGVLRVLVADSVPVTGTGLRVLIDGSPDLAAFGVASTADAAIALAREVRPHVVVMDSALDVAASASRALRAQDRAVKLISLVDERGAHLYVREAAQAGVNALVPRAAPPVSIVQALRATRGGRTVVDPLFAPLLVESGSWVLSERQAAVLRLVATGHDTAAIAAAMLVSTETVRSHIKAILRRLDARDRAHAVARGYELGLLRIGTTAQSRPST